METVNCKERLPVFAISRHRINTDGVGVTSLVGAYGCPLQCRYCINPHAWNPKTLEKCRLLTAEELYEELKIDSLYFISTGGGVTFGGGESLLHADFYREFRDICGKEWNLTVETSLNVDPVLLKKSIDVIDDYTIDIKDINPEIYMSYTGMGNERVIENLNTLLQYKSKNNIYIRVPHIPHYNQEADVYRTIEMLKSIGIKNIDVFTYIVKSNS